MVEEVWRREDEESCPHWVNLWVDVHEVIGAINADKIPNIGDWPVVFHLRVDFEEES